ncbi:hypothetical protein PTSG_07708 [Salpingoeca rosetta]|uniref:Exportin-1/Importin-beta-like domain-containing protein n=1 Tax=Salpingoeca rosetta (strain ATCC 50818 / BSB-021) TaxID=946362 RepID=F2UHJ2_SALR5|nr:uncharacterized protein PTSG_07708 [Salpingoeca rosetta]EGD76591.1 hypothetical protein PTSG_07708 [Salpingoeca rosetta]|eukprot:XP_004991505.1 hypothetical protein PTSG_07708 [Salpingoeca rosetta]
MDLDGIVGAVQAFYHSDDLKLRTQAEEYLQEVRSAPDSMHIVPYLLAPQTSPEVHFFAISVLQANAATIKSQNPEVLGHLQQLLLNLIFEFSSLETFVYRSLCAVMATVIFRSVPESMQGVFGQIVEDIMPRSQLAGLEFIKAFIQEGCKMIQQKTITPASMQELQAAQPTALAALQTVLSQNMEVADVSLAVTALQSLAACIETGIVPLAALNDHLNLTLAFTGSDETFSAAMECLVALAGHPGLEDEPEALSAFVTTVLSLREMYDASLAQQDDEKTEWMCKLVTELVDDNIDTLLTLAEGPALFDLFIHMTDHPLQFGTQETQSELTLKVWYRVLQGFVELERETRHRTRRVYLPHIMQLLRVLQRKMMYPPAIETLNEHYQESIEKYRHEAGNVIMFISCFTTLNCVQVLAELLEAGLRDDNWLSVESSLTCIYRAATFSPAADDEHMPRIVAMLESLPPNKFISIASVRVAGALGAWLRNRPDQVTTMLDIILKNLLTVTPQPRTGVVSRDTGGNWTPDARRTLQTEADAGAEAFRDLCEGCDDLLLPYVNSINLAYRDAASHGLSTESRALVAEGLVLISRKTNLDRAVDLLQNTLQRELEEIDNCACTAQAALQPTQLKCAASDIRVLGHAIRFLRIKEESLRLRQLISKVSALSVQLILRHSSDEPLMQALCDMLMNCMRVNVHLLDTNIGMLAPAVGSGFVESQHACLVDLLTSSISVYGRDEAHTAMFLDVFRKVHGGVVGWFEAGQHVESPDATAGYFRLVCRMLRTLGEDVFLSEAALSRPVPLVLTMTQWSIAALMLQEPHVVKQACNAIVELLRMLAKSPAAAEDILGEKGVGHICVETCMQSMCTSAPAICVPDIARCIGTFQLNFSTILQQVLPAIVAALPVSVREDVKESLLQQMFQLDSIGQLTSLLKSFSAMCRAV